VSTTLRVVVAFLAACVAAATLYAITSSTRATAIVGILAMAAACAALFLNPGRGTAKDAPAGAKEGSSVDVKARKVSGHGQVIGVEGGTRQPDHVRVDAERVRGRGGVWGVRGSGRRTEADKDPEPN